MKRINIFLSNELATRLEALAERKETSVAEIARRSLEVYLQRFPERPVTNTKLPTFPLGKPLKKDFKAEIYHGRVKEVAS